MVIPISSFLFCKQNMVSQLVFILLNINIHFREIFHAENFVLSMIIRIFAARESAKPLNDAQMCGSFLFLWVYMATRIPFIKTYSTDLQSVVKKCPNPFVFWGFAIPGNRFWLICYRGITNPPVS